MFTVHARSEADACPELISTSSIFCFQFLHIAVFYVFSNEALGKIRLVPFGTTIVQAFLININADAESTLSPSHMLSHNVSVFMFGRRKSAVEHWLIPETSVICTVPHHHHHHRIAI